MFEAQIDTSRLVPAADHAELRAFDWQELSARLAAARDLRSVVVHRRAARNASFDRAAAQLIAGHGNDKRPVNPKGLGHGKTPCGITPLNANDAANGDRE